MIFLSLSIWMKSLASLSIYKRVLGRFVYINVADTNAGATNQKCKYAKPKNSQSCSKWLYSKYLYTR